MIRRAFAGLFAALALTSCSLPPTPTGEARENARDLTRFEAVHMPDSNYRIAVGCDGTTRVYVHDRSGAIAVVPNDPRCAP